MMLDLVCLLHQWQSTSRPSRWALYRLSDPGDREHDSDHQAALPQPDGVSCAGKPRLLASGNITARGCDGWHDDWDHTSWCHQLLQYEDHECPYLHPVSELLQRAVCITVFRTRCRPPPTPSTARRLSCGSPGCSLKLCSRSHKVKCLHIGLCDAVLQLKSSGVFLTQVQWAPFTF